MIYEGTVVKTMEFVAFVNFFPGMFVGQAISYARWWQRGRLWRMDAVSNAQFDVGACMLRGTRSRQVLLRIVATQEAVQQHRIDVDEQPPPPQEDDAAGENNDNNAAVPPAPEESEEEAIGEWVGEGGAPATSFLNGDCGEATRFCSRPLRSAAATAARFVGDSAADGDSLDSSWEGTAPV